MKPIERTFLIGAGGTGTAFGACTALRRHWGNSVKIVVMDINPKHLVSSSILSDVYIQVSPFSNELFQSELLEILNRENVGFYLPLFPVEIPLAASLREQGFLNSRTTVLSPGLETCRITSDKYLTALWLEENQFPTPRTCLVQPEFRADFYCIKPRMGSGSVGTRILSPAAMDAELQVTSFPANPSDGVIIQERCDQPEVTIDVFRSAKDNAVRVLCRDRLQVKSGVSTKVRIYEDTKLASLATRLAEGLNISGTFCFQTMMLDGDWCVVDINARPGAATSTCAATGNDFFGALFAHAMGEETGRFFRKLTSPLFVTRQYSDFLMS